MGREKEKRGAHTGGGEGKRKEKGRDQYYLIIRFGNDPHSLILRITKKTEVLLFKLGERSK